MSSPPEGSLNSACPQRPCACREGETWLVAGRGLRVPSPPLMTSPLQARGVVRGLREGAVGPENAAAPCGHDGAQLRGGGWHRCAGRATRTRRLPSPRIRGPVGAASSGVSFKERQVFGAYVSIAIAIHNIPEGLAIALVLVPEGRSVRCARGSPPPGAPARLTPRGRWGSGRRGACSPAHAHGRRPRYAAAWAILSSLPQPCMALPAYAFVHSFDWLLPIGLGFAASSMAHVAVFDLMKVPRGRVTREPTVDIYMHSFSISADMCTAGQGCPRALAAPPEGAFREGTTAAAGGVVKRPVAPRAPRPPERRAGQGDHRAAHQRDPRPRHRGRRSFPPRHRSGSAQSRTPTGSS